MDSFIESPFPRLKKTSGLCDEKTWMYGCKPSWIGTNYLGHKPRKMQTPYAIIVRLCDTSIVKQKESTCNLNGTASISFYKKINIKLE